MKYFVSALIAGMSAATPDVAWESMGYFKMSNPAFVEITSFHNSDPFFLCSSFSAGPLGSGKVYVIPDITTHIKDNAVSNMKAKKIKVGESLEWPNDVKVVP